MEINAKVGTMPQHRYRLKRLRRLPRLNEIIWIASVTEIRRSGKAALPSLWQRVRVKSISSMGNDYYLFKVEYP